jgi:hypothetical protein
VAVGSPHALALALLLVLGNADEDDSRSVISSRSVIRTSVSSRALAGVCPPSCATWGTPFDQSAPGNPAAQFS